MLLLGVKEELQEKVKRALEERGVLARVWYECRGDEEVVIVPADFVKEEGFVLELEVED